jgi:hypothetical protein
MASRMYDKGRQKFLEGSIAWLTNDIKVVCVDAADYTIDTAAHEFLSDIPAGGRVGTSGNLSNKTSTLGVADADDVTITGVTGDQFEYVILYKDTGVASTSPLICIFDTGTGLPFTPSGGDITIQFDSGANKIFKL